MVTLGVPPPTPVGILGAEALHADIGIGKATSGSIEKGPFQGFPWFPVKKWTTPNLLISGAGHLHYWDFGFDLVWGSPNWNSLPALPFGPVTLSTSPTKPCFTSSFRLFAFPAYHRRGKTKAELTTCWLFYMHNEPLDTAAEELRNEYVIKGEKILSLY